MPHMFGVAQLARLCDLSIDLLAVCGFDGYFKSLNPAWTRTLGWSRSELLNNPFMDYVHVDDVASTRLAFAQLLAGDDLLPVHGFANRYRAKNGSYRWLRWSCAADLDAKFIYATAHDATDWKNAQDEMHVLQVKLEQLVRTDVLTGMVNRRGGEELLGRSVAAAKRFLASCSIAIIDIDHFKRINDTHGHQQGDAVISALGSLLTREVRGADAVCRWGGEEFMAFLPSTNLAGAIQFGERIRGQVHLAMEHMKPPFTVSIGVAEFVKDDTAESWVERADKKLYEAKNAGRDCVRG